MRMHSCRVVDVCLSLATFGACVKWNNKNMNYFSTTKCCLHLHCHFIEIIHQRHRIHSSKNRNSSIITIDRAPTKIRRFKTCSDAGTHTHHTPQWSARPQKYSIQKWSEINKQEMEKTCSNASILHMRSAHTPTASIKISRQIPRKNTQSDNRNIKNEL